MIHPSPTHGHMTSTLNGRERERMREKHGGREKRDREEGKGRKKGETGQLGKGQELTISTA